MGNKQQKRPSLLDRAIAKVNPVSALKREKARRELEFLNSGYSHHGANTHKKSVRDWDSESNSPDEDINANLPLARERSRDMYMGGSNIATGAIKTTRTSVVGSGLVLKPKIDSEFLRMSDNEAQQWEKTAAREFEYFASSVNCDRFRMNNFYELQQLAFISMLLSGDVFVLLPYRSRQGFAYDLRIQLVEGDRIMTPPIKEGSPNISQGVETRRGEVVAYHVSNHYPGSRMDDMTFRRIPAFGAGTGRRNILHLMESERPDQTRGMPMLAPVIETLRDLGTYVKNELRAAVLSAMYTTFVRTHIPEGGIGEGIPEDERIEPGNSYVYELGPGTVVHLKPGESIEHSSPGRPNPEFDNFVNAAIRNIGAATGIPYEILIMHFSASYSASRAALLMAWEMYKMRRKWFANDFCQPIYEEWMCEAVAKGRIYAPGFFDDPIIRAAYCRAEWHGPSQGQIDPSREARAAEARIQSCISTREREAAEMTGTDFNVNLKQRVKEETMRLELLKLEKSLEGGDK